MFSALKNLWVLIFGVRLYGIPMSLKQAKEFEQE